MGWVNNTDWQINSDVKVFHFKSELSYSFKTWYFKDDYLEKEFVMRISYTKTRSFWK